jgi:hypothetical protein
MCIVLLFIMLAQTVLPRAQSHKANTTSKSGLQPVSSEKSSETRSQYDVEASESACHGQADFRQHEIPICGLKQLCLFNPCEYATGKVDKMMEHMRNMHETAGKYTMSLSAKAMPNQLSLRSLI